MSDVMKKLTKLLEDWLIDPTQVDTLAFTFKRGRVDENFLEVEIYFLTRNPISAEIQSGL